MPADQPPSTPLVETTDLTKRFGDFTALDKINLTVDRGEVFGLLGPNGAGKSTLIRTLMGFLKPTSGTATVDGLDSLKDRVAIHRQIAYLPGDARLYSMMKGRNLLRLQCSFRETASFEKGIEIARRLDLDLDRWVGLMSTGMRQKLALTATLASEVPLLILDEPTANLDPTVRGEVLAMVTEAQARGTTVIFSSHVLSEIEDTCGRVGILRAGQMVHMEAMADLKRQHRIRAKLESALPALPKSLADQVVVKQDKHRIQIETSGDLSPLLKWLAEIPITDVHVRPVGLRAVYDRFHFPNSVPVGVESGE
jgi:ABC-2 type transport system ATP-binding protein